MRGEREERIERRDRNIYQREEKREEREKYISERGRRKGTK